MVFPAVAASLASAAATWGLNKLSGGDGGNRQDLRFFKKQQKDIKKQTKFGQKAYKRQQKLFEKSFKKYGGEKFTRYPSQTPEQQSLLDYMSKYGRGRTDLRGVLSQTPLYKAGQRELLDLFKTNPESYNQFKAPIMREFQEEIAPGIAGRFAGTGGFRSSSFQNALSAAGGSLSEKLGALRAGLRQSALSPALQYAQAPIENQLRAGQLSLGTDPYINIYRPPTIPGQPSPPTAVVGGGGYRGGGTPGFLGNLGGSLGGALGQGLGQGLAEKTIGGIFSGTDPSRQVSSSFPGRQQPMLGSAGNSFLNQFGFGLRT